MLISVLLASALVLIQGSMSLAHGADHLEVDLQKQIDEVQPGGVLHLPAGVYHSAGLYIDKPITIKGDGVGTRVIMTGKTGFLIDINQGEVRNRESHNYGVILDGLYLGGSDRKYPVGAISVSMLDHATIENVFIEDFKGPAFYVNDSFRESVINNIHIRYCGSEGHPSVDIGHHTGQDGTNNIYISNLFIAYSFSTDISIGNTTGSKKRVRHIYLDHVFAHGTVSAAQDLYYAWTKAELSSPRLEVLNAFDVVISDSYLAVAGLGAPVVRLRSEGGRRSTRYGYLPAMVGFRGVTIQGHYEQTVGQSYKGIGIKIETGSAVNITECRFIDHPGGAIVSSVDGVVQRNNYYFRSK